MHCVSSAINRPNGAAVTHLLSALLVGVRIRVHRRHYDDGLNMPSSIAVPTVGKASCADDLSVIILRARSPMTFNWDGYIEWDEHGQTTRREIYLTKAGQLYDIVYSFLESTCNTHQDTEPGDESSAS
jgi:hypothetical protein